MGLQVALKIEEHVSKKIDEGKLGGRTMFKVLSFLQTIARSPVFSMESEEVMPESQPHMTRSGLALEATCMMGHVCVALDLEDVIAEKFKEMKGCKEWLNTHDGNAWLARQFGAQTDEDVKGLMAAIQAVMISNDEEFVAQRLGALAVAYPYDVKPGLRTTLGKFVGAIKDYTGGDDV